MFHEDPDPIGFSVHVGSVICHCSRLGVDGDRRKFRAPNGGFEMRGFGRLSHTVNVLTIDKSGVRTPTFDPTGNGALLDKSPTPLLLWTSRSP